MYVISFEKSQNHITWKGHSKVIESNLLLKPVSLTGSPSWLYPSQILNFSKDGESPAPSHSGSPPLDLHPSCTEVPQTGHKYNQSNLTISKQENNPLPHPAAYTLANAAQLAASKGTLLACVPLVL